MALTQATELADFTSGIGTAGAILEVDNNNNRIGIGTTNPQALLQVGQIIKMDGPSGIVTATTFSGNFTGKKSKKLFGKTPTAEQYYHQIFFHYVLADGQRAHCAWDRAR